MREPKYENFEDPRDYFSAKCDWLQARVQELERYEVTDKEMVAENTRLATRVQELEEKSRIDDEQGDLMAEECARLAIQVKELKGQLRASLRACVALTQALMESD